LIFATHVNIFLVFLSFLFAVLFSHLSAHKKQAVCHNILHKTTVLLIISIDCYSDSQFCHWIFVFHCYSLKRALKLSVGNRECTIYILNVKQIFIENKFIKCDYYFLQSLRRAGSLVAEPSYGFFDTSCHGVCNSGPKSTVGKNGGCTFHLNALRTWIIR